MRLAAAPLVVAALLLTSCGQGPQLYPTDRCVAEKVFAAGEYCRAALLALGRGDQTEADADLLAARDRLAASWASAEADSAAEGVDCADTTATAGDLIDQIDAGALALATEIDASSGATPAETAQCRSRRHVLAARACRDLLGIEHMHLVERRDFDRDRTALQVRRDTINDWLEAQWSSGQAAVCDGGPAPAEAVAQVGALVEETFLANVVSPNVSTEWTLVTPDDQVPYQGETLEPDTILEPICSFGTPWVFFVKRGTVNKTLMYYQGGGACWSFFTCNLPTHKTSVSSTGDNPANASSGFANLDDPDNPFRDWNVVFVPYCTGDVHWGDAVVEHLGRNSNSITVHHKGYVNAQVAEKWAREHFVSPDQVFVTGSSAGAYGAIVNSLPLQEYVWPSADFAVLGDAGNGVITQDFLENDLAKWGIEQNLPEWIPALQVPLTELNAADLWKEPALHYPRNRFANYTTAYDGGQGGQVGFYNTMIHADNPAAWFRWWEPSCEWNDQMRDLVQTAASDAPNYRYYIGTGSRHTMWGHNKVYTDTTGGVPTIASWIQAMLDGSIDWTNVECTDCGTLLTGDPRPNPPEPPYTPDGIDCSE